MANTSAIWQQAAHTTYQLSSVQTKFIITGTTKIMETRITAIAF